jgi:uncharacterized protein
VAATTFEEEKMNRRWILLGTVTAALLLTACTGATTTPSTPSTPCNVTCNAATQPYPRQLSVNGEGTVKVSPDIAVMYLSVITQDPLVSKAWDDNNAKATAVIAAIEGLGVKSEDLRSDFSVVQQDKYDPITSRPTGEIFYIVTHTLTVTARDLTKVGAILGAAQAAGINSVGGVIFTLEDPTPAISQARALAVADARARADEIAKGLGVKIVRVLTVNEYGASIPVPMDKGYNSLGIGGGGGGSSVPIQVGTWSVSMSVNVIFEIGD